MEVEFVPVTTKEQIETLCEIAEIIWHATYDDLVSKEQTDYMIEQFQSPAAVDRQLRELNYRYYLIVCGGSNAGFVGISPRYEGREELFLSKIYLLSEYRGQGAIRKAFALVEEETRKEGLSVIRLTVNKNNTHAIEVYRHMGFETAEAVVTDIGHGYVMDDYIMIKKLAGSACE